MYLDPNKYNNHHFKNNFKPGELYIICNKCNIKFDIYGVIYRNEYRVFKTMKYVTLTCDEILIKNILE